MDTPETLPDFSLLKQAKALKQKQTEARTLGVKCAHMVLILYAGDASGSLGLAYLLSVIVIGYRLLISSDDMPD